VERYQKVVQFANQLRPEAVEFARRLVRCPSLGGSEKGVADLLLSEMRSIGYDQVFRDDWGNVVGIIDGNQPGPAIVYNGHMDHVPPGELSLWGRYDPYAADIDVVEIDNRYANKKERAEVIHGRGVADLKGALACVIYAGKLLLELRNQGLSLNGKYIVTAVCLEEPGDQVGTIQLIDDTFKKLHLDYDAAVSCEPSSLDIALGHRGRVEPVVSVYGKICHGSAPWLGINAVYKASKFIDKVANELPNSFASDPDLGRSSIAMTIIKASPGELCIVPERCDMNFDRRFVPGETPESCIQQLQNIIDDLSKEDPEFRAEVKIAEAVQKFYTGKSVKIANRKNAWKTPREHPFVQAMAAGLEAVGQEVGYRYWYFGTDLSKVVAEDRKPAIGYGAGQEQLIHTPAEQLRTDYMEKSIAGYAAGFLKIMELPKEAFQLEGQIALRESR
jgi:putative selenium metabolism hydrolase